jgi:UTP--glucose-1-phosphate uridylyltransferase
MDFVRLFVACVNGGAWKIVFRNKNQFRELIIMDKFLPFEDRMTKENVPKLMIETFKYYYNKLVSGETGMIHESSIKPVDTLPDSETFDDLVKKKGEDALSKAVMIKLNGGLGTSMGLEKAKSLLTVKEGLTFLDIIAQHAIHSRVPLILMNSFSTRDDSLNALARYPELQKSGLSLDFLQHKAPKIFQSDYSPAIWKSDPELEWYPPGHGDLYTALVTSGMLDSLLNADFEYAFVSNSDNLGASLDLSILGYFALNNLPFMMECADRTEADKKGGHLAKQKDGQLILRESAQCPEEDKSKFHDVSRHKYFNTNNLWLNLKVLKSELCKSNNVLELPIIRNSKSVDPRDSKSPAVYQLETAMGSAIALFKNAKAIRVPRIRFAPVKATSDLLAVQSDAYVLTYDYRVVLHPKRKGKAVLVELDTKFYKMIDQLEERFPAGIPSLIDCERFTVKGDMKFGKGTVAKGVVYINNQTGIQLIIPDNKLL